MSFFASKRYQRVTNFAFAAILVVSTFTASVPFLFSKTANAVSGTTYTVCEVAGPDCTYTLIQDAIDAASTGDTVKVAPGTYTGDITINKDITVMTPHTDGVIAGQVTIPAAGSGATLKGFTVQTTGKSYSVGISNADNVTIDNNTINHTSFNGSAKAIYVGDGDNSGIAITHNYISTITSTMGGAYGILVNKKNFSNLTISNNYVKTLTGVWTHAIGLEGNTPNAVVANNHVSGLSTYGGGTDIFAVHFEDNASASTVSLSGDYNAKPLTNSASDIYVDANWSGLANNSEVLSGDGVYRYIGQNAFNTIQSAIDAAADNAKVSVSADTYNENVTVDHPVVLNGAQANVDARNRSGNETNVTSFTVTASDVMINGFSMTQHVKNQINVAPSPSAGLTLSGLVFTNNIFDGYTSVALTTNNAGNVQINHNSFSNVDSANGGLESMQLRSNGAPQSCNGSNISDNLFTQASVNGADINLSCTGSASTGITVTGNSSTGSVASFIAVSGVAGDLNIQGNTATAVQNNTAIYFFGAVTGSVNVRGNSITGGNSSALAISNGAYDGSTFHTGAFVIENNDFSNNLRGISVTNGAFNGTASLTAHNNNLADNGDAGIRNETTTLVNATENFWGNISGPTDTVATDGSTPATNTNGTGSVAFGAINYGPWCTDATCSTLSNASLAAPTNLTPANGTYTDNNKFDQTWSPVAGAAKYEYKTTYTVNGTTRTFKDFSTASNYDVTPTLVTRHNGVSKDATYSWQVRAYNAQGTPGAWSAVQTVTIDTVNPVVGLTAPVGTTAQDSVDYSGYVNDDNFSYYNTWISTNQPISAFGKTFATGQEPKDANGSLARPGNTTWMTASTKTGVGSPADPVVLGSYDISGLPDGSYTIHLSGHDLAKNVVTDSITFTIDRTTVSTPISNPAQDSTSNGGTDTGARQLINVNGGGNTPTITSPAAAAVLGATDDKTADQKGNTDVKGATDDKTADAVNSEANNGTVFGIAWYWWILILAALALIVGYIVSAIRRRNEGQA